MKIVYKCKHTGEVSSTVDLNEFEGYKIQLENGKISKIYELLNHIVLCRIDYRPTKATLIHKIEYNGHIEYRYNNNRVNSLYYEFENKKYGEYKKFDTTGNLIQRIFYYEDKDITDDIMKFIGYDDEPSNFMNYTFTESELFNVMMKYGFYFRFCYEAGRESTEFDLITEYCKNM